MVEKDYKLYGTKILNLKTQEIGLLICLWENKYANKLWILPPVWIKTANAITLNLII